MTIARTLCVLLTLTAVSALQPAPHVRPALRPAARAVLVASEPVAAVGTARSFSASWGVLGVIGILAKAIKRLAPHAVQPLVQRDLTLLQWGLYGTSLTFFAYVEGYKAFQCKFSPLVVQRAMTLAAPGAPVGHRVAAPFYSMGLFHATKKRKIVSWSVSLSASLPICEPLSSLPSTARAPKGAAATTALALPSRCAAQRMEGAPSKEA